MVNLQKVKLLITTSTIIFLMAACGEQDGSQSRDTDNGVTVITSFSILADITENIQGDRGTVDHIVPVGEQPEEYEPVPSDFRNVSDADVFYVNGLGLEEWLSRIVENASDTPVIELTDGADDIIPLEGEDTPDPHLWLSPKRAELYINNIVDDLIDKDPDGEDIYRENADKYMQEIQELDIWIEQQTEGIPEEYRTIVISENAFKYFGEDYGFRTEGIWELNSHEEGTTGQINRVIDVVVNEGLPAVFVESTVDNRYMETVVGNTEAEIAGEVYTDAFGQKGSGAETYIDMLRHNAETISKGLSEE